jgi:hypothetical protein
VIEHVACPASVDAVSSSLRAFEASGLPWFGPSGAFVLAVVEVREDEDESSAGSRCGLSQTVPHGCARVAQVGLLRPNQGRSGEIRSVDKTSCDGVLTRVAACRLVSPTRRDRRFVQPSERAERLPQR